MKAVVLTVEQDTRLRPLTNHLPKCLLQVALKTTVRHQQESLELARIQYSNTVMGSLGGQVQHHF
jgi:NDP-sugar pyrophosphorylase family protein